VNHATIEKNVGLLAVVLAGAKRMRGRPGKRAQK
jgi:hypothetical protein